MGGHQQFTAPYTPQENPTERANRTIKTIIAQLTGKNHQTWDDHLPKITLAINLSVSETTTYTPAYLMQGRELRLPGGLYDENILGNGKANENAEEANRLKEVFEITRRNLAKAANTQARHYNLRRRKWQPEIGELVLVRQHPLSKTVDKFAAKLAPKYAGPYAVWKYKSPVVLEVKASTGEIQVAYVGDLKKYYPETETNNQRKTGREPET